MRFTFYSAAAFAALLGQQGADAAKAEFAETDETYAQLEAQPEGYGFA